jgi:hypothetical protein
MRGKTSGTGASPAMRGWNMPLATFGARATPSEGIEIDECAAYFALLTYDQDERGIACRARAPWRRRPSSSRRSHVRPRRAGSRPQGEGGQVMVDTKDTGRYA